MIVDFKPGDGQLLAASLTLYVRACESAQKACEKIGYPTVLAIVEAHSWAQGSLETVKEWIDVGGDCPRDADLSAETRDAMRRGLFLALEKLGKLEDGQTELGIVPEDTRTQQEHARDLSDRLNGELRLPLDEVGADAIKQAALSGA